jgi:site-specific DNA-methyltransferase (adenine-specific)
LGISGAGLDKFQAAQRASIERTATLGRWPANIIHDGSEEVIAAFPETESGAGNKANKNPTTRDSQVIPTIDTGQIWGGDSGSAARFFYTAKADADDRLGSKHPTVKPVDLMQWLCRLVTPKGGTVLDPFAGTGTTGEAAFREGFNAVLIEREEEYQADIRRRMSLCMSGPDERKRESIKAKLGDVPFEPGSLFA